MIVRIVNKKIQSSIDPKLRCPSFLEQEEVSVPVDEGSRPGDAGRGTAVARKLQEPDWKRVRLERSIM